MNCRTMRVGGMAAAMLLGGMMAQSTAQAQAAAKATAGATGEVQTPAAVYSQMLKLVSSQVISAAEAMPADKYDFAPTNGNFAGVRTFGAEVQHLVGANYFFFNGFGLSGAPDQAKIKALKGKDELVQALKDSYAYAQKGVDTITPQNAFVTIGSGPAGIKFTRASAATFCMAHSMDHYGQMVEYLRDNGIVPPASQPKKK
jgi:uncharacterized damage-inducible protein DinB